MSSKKKGRVTREQIITMLDYFAANPTLAEKNIHKHFTKEELNKKWEEMAALLHAAEGPEKTIEQWQVVWRDMKSRTKMKIKDCRQKIQNGESISTNNTFSDLELRVIDILGTEDAESIKNLNNSATDRKQNIFHKFEPMNDDSWSDPLSMQQIEEEYIEYDEDYEPEVTPAKRMKTNTGGGFTSSAAISQKHHHGERDSRRSFAEITKVQANAMMMQAEAAKTSAEAAKLNAEAAKMYALAAKSNAEALNKLADAINLAVDAFSKK